VCSPHSLTTATIDNVPTAGTQHIQALRLTFTHLTQIDLLPVDVPFAPEHDLNNNGAIVNKL
jgi:hypothetical protein